MIISVESHCRCGPLASIFPALEPKKNCLGSVGVSKAEPLRGLEAIHLLSVWVVTATSSVSLSLSLLLSLSLCPTTIAPLGDSYLVLGITPKEIANFLFSISGPMCDSSQNIILYLKQLLHSNPHILKSVSPYQNVYFV